MTLGLYYFQPVQMSDNQPSSINVRYVHTFILWCKGLPREKLNMGGRIYTEVGAGAFFALVSAEPKNERESEKKKSAKKAEAPK